MFESWLFYFHSSFLLVAWEKCKNPSIWAPITFVENQNEAPGCWLQPGSALVVQLFGNEPADGTFSLPLSSLTLTFKQVSNPFKNAFFALKTCDLILYVNVKRCFWRTQQIQPTGVRHIKWKSKSAILGGANTMSQWLNPLPACIVSILCEHLLGTQLFNFQSSSLLIHLGKQWRMSQVLGSLHPSGRARRPSHRC